MIIISQDREKIINFDKVLVVEIDDNVLDRTETTFAITVETDGTAIELGYYSTKERAKEVLQQIVRTIIEVKRTESVNNVFGFNITPSNTIYEMPEN